MFKAQLVYSKEPFNGRNGQKKNRVKAERDTGRPPGIGLPVLVH